MARFTHNQIIDQLMKKVGVRDEYETLCEEFDIFEAMLKARLKSGKTQADIAQELHTTKSAVSRLENSGGRKKHSPTIETLRKYAKAVGCDLKIEFVPHPL